MNLTEISLIGQATWGDKWMSKILGYNEESTYPYGPCACAGEQDRRETAFEGKKKVALKLQQELRNLNIL